ncbi:aldo/keto reductase, partial [Klebsiella pneumoniae]|nr:aldo/keto reductase [Klebsiella pneumoniae]
LRVRPRSIGLAQQPLGLAHAAQAELHPAHAVHDERLARRKAQGLGDQVARLFQTFIAIRQRITECVVGVVVLDEIARQHEKTVAQVALNWVLRRPSVANVVIGARNEEQLQQNLGALGWELSPQDIARLDEASHKEPAYPYWHQKGFASRNPKPTRW